MGHDLSMMGMVLAVVFISPAKRPLQSVALFQKCKHHRKCVSRLSWSLAEPIFNAATTIMLSDLHNTV